MRKLLCLCGFLALAAVAQDGVHASLPPVEAALPQRVVERCAPAVVTVEMDLRIEPAGRGLRFRNPATRHLSVRGTVVDGEHGVVAVPAALLEPLAGVRIVVGEGKKAVPVALPAKPEKMEIVTAAGKRNPARWLGVDNRTGLGFLAADPVPAGGWTALVAEPAAIEAGVLDEVLVVQPLASFVKPAFGLRRSCVSARITEPIIGWACDGEPGWPVFKKDGCLLGIVSIAAGTPSSNSPADAEKGVRRREAVALVVPMPAVTAAARELLQKAPKLPAAAK
jgi:hypothetical protein